MAPAAAVVLPSLRFLVKPATDNNKAIAVGSRAGLMNNSLMIVMNLAILSIRELPILVLLIPDPDQATIVVDPAAAATTITETEEEEVVASFKKVI